MKIGDIQVSLENVIFFDKNKNSLQDFIDKMVPGNITVVDDIDEALEEFDEDLPELARQVDIIEHTNIVYQIKKYQQISSYSDEDTAESTHNN